MIIEKKIPVRFSLDDGSSSLSVIGIGDKLRPKSFASYTITICIENVLTLSSLAVRESILQFLYMG